SKVSLKWLAANSTRRVCHCPDATVSLHAVTTLASHDVERTALAVYSLVKDHVALERVRARDVVVVRIFCPPNDPASLVLFAADRFELHFHESVLQIGVVLEANGKRRHARLL